jgi:hypothetical protein
MGLMMVQCAITLHFFLLTNCAAEVLVTAHTCQRFTCICESCYGDRGYTWPCVSLACAAQMQLAISFRVSWLGFIGALA